MLKIIRTSRRCNLSFDRLDVSDYLPEDYYKHIINSEQDHSCDDPDCLYEPPLVFDQDAEARCRDWEESLLHLEDDISEIVDAARRLMK